MSAASTETPADHCLRCDYDLRGIDDRKPCPECGLLAERSRRPTDRLRDSQPAYLRKLSIGAWLLLIALAWPLVLPFLVQGLRFLVDARYFSVSFEVVDHLWICLVDVAALLMIAGVWMVISREPRDEAPPERLRFWLRIFALAPLAVLLAEHLRIEVIHYQRAHFPWIGWHSSAVYDPAARRMAQYLLAADLLRWMALLVFVSPLPALLFAYLRHLARRLLSRQMTEHSAIVGIGSAATIALFGGYAMFFEIWDWFEMPRVNPKSAGAQVVSGTCIVAIVLFWLWTVYLMLRFAIAFGWESRAMRTAWREADFGQAQQQQ